VPFGAGKVVIPPLQTSATGQHLLSCIEANMLSAQREFDMLFEVLRILSGNIRDLKSEQSQIRSGGL